MNGVGTPVAFGGQQALCSDRNGEREPGTPLLRGSETAVALSCIETVRAVLHYDLTASD